MRPYYEDELSKDNHALDLYKKKRGTPQSSMQIRIYDKTDSLITGYAQCYGNLNWINILGKEEFVRYSQLPNNYNLKFKDELDLTDTDSVEKKQIFQESQGKNKIVIYWNIWSNHYSKVMLKKTRKYIRKFDPKMEKTFVLLINNDLDSIRKGNGTSH
jgi:hypothetical protein